MYRTATYDDNSVQRTARHELALPSCLRDPTNVHTRLLCLPDLTIVLEMLNRVDACVDHEW